jgi:hypothetical protein
VLTPWDLELKPKPAVCWNIKDFVPYLPQGGSLAFETILLNYAWTVPGMTAYQLIAVFAFKVVQN